MDNALARLHKAEEDVAALREAIKAAQAKARATPKKRKKGEEDMSATPCFEVSAEERTYKGDPNDRKQIVKHRQRMKVRVILVAGKGQLVCSGGCVARTSRNKSCAIVGYPVTSLPAAPAPTLRSPLGAHVSCRQSFTYEVVFKRQNLSEPCCIVSGTDTTSAALLPCSRGALIPGKPL